MPEIDQGISAVFALYEYSRQSHLPKQKELQSNLLTIGIPL